MPDPRADRLLLALSRDTDLAWEVMSRLKVLGPWADKSHNERVRRDPLGSYEARLRDNFPNGYDLAIVTPTGSDLVTLGKVSPSMAIEKADAVLQERGFLLRQG